MTPPIVRSTVLCSAVAGLLSSGLSAQTSQTIDDVVRWLDPLLLEETDDALTARPRLAIDPSGGFIVSDGQENQVRLYDADGSLQAYFGRVGDGPGEFQSLQAAVRLASGEIAAVDFEGRLSIWSAEGELEVDHRLDFGGLLGVWDLGADRVTVGTVPSPVSFEDLDAPIFHDVSVESGELSDSYFSFPLNPDNAMTALTVLGGMAPSNSRLQGVTWTVFDSLWVVDRSRRVIVRRMQLESSVLSKNRPPVDRRRDPEGFGEWMRSSAIPVEAFAAPGGGWLVTISSRAEEGPKWTLLRVDEEGRRVWEVDDAPRLEAVDRQSGTLYFRYSDSLEPSRFERAKLRGSGSS